MGTLYFKREVKKRFILECTMKKLIDNIYAHFLIVGFWKKVRNGEQKEYCLLHAICKIGDLQLSIIFNNRNQTKNGLNIEQNLSSIYILLLNYAAHYGISAKQIEKHIKLELLATEHLKLNPETYLFYLCNVITQIKYVVWPAQHIGEALGKIITIANHYKIDIDKEVREHLEQQINLHKKTLVYDSRRKSN